MPRCKYISKERLNRIWNGRPPLSSFPHFHASGSISGMKRLYYGKNALLVRHGQYIYNVTSCPKIWDNAK